MRYDNARHAKSTRSIGKRKSWVRVPAPDRQEMNVGVQRVTPPSTLRSVSLVIIPFLMFIISF